MNPPYLLTPSLTPTPTLTATQTETPTPVATQVGVYEAGETWTFYYYAGSERIALRVNKENQSAVYYLFGDHLGSTTVVMKSDGSVQGVEKYKAFGENRYPQDQPDLKTERRYTGQLEVGFGLYFYQSRFYDPLVGRFVQADTTIPGSTNPTSWDRYAYGLNNPVILSDPTGHSPICVICLVEKIIGEYLGAALGTVDMAGIAKAEVAMGGNGGSSEVAAGLAIQSEYAGVLDDIVGLWPGESGYGLAQVGQTELDFLGLGKDDPHNSDVAVKVMQARMEKSREACINCNTHDLLIVAALAQNGQFKNQAALDQLKELTGRAGRGDMDWAAFINGNTHGGI